MAIPFSDLKNVFCGQILQKRFSTLALALLILLYWFGGHIWQFSGITQGN